VDDLLAAGVFACTELVLGCIVRERAAVVKFGAKSGFDCMCVSTRCMTVGESQ
jgi:hypothetical protein